MTLAMTIGTVPFALAAALWPGPRLRRLLGPDNVECLVIGALPFRTHGMAVAVADVRAGALDASRAIRLACGYRGRVRRAARRKNVQYTRAVITLRSSPALYCSSQRSTV